MTRSGTRCSVAVCKSSFYTSKGKGMKTSFFTFPKDPTLRKKWVTQCHRKDEWNVDFGRICSIHFRSEDFQRDLQYELLNLPPRKILKTDAVPSLYLTPQALQGYELKTKRKIKKKFCESNEGNNNGKTEGNNNGKTEGNNGKTD